MSKSWVRPYCFTIPTLSLFAAKQNTSQYVLQHKTLEPFAWEPWDFLWECFPCWIKNHNLKDVWQGNVVLSFPSLIIWRFLHVQPHKGQVYTNYDRIRVAACTHCTLCTRCTPSTECFIGPFWSTCTVLFCIHSVIYSAHTKLLVYNYKQNIALKFAMTKSAWPKAISP